MFPKSGFAQCSPLSPIDGHLQYHRISKVLSIIQIWHIIFIVLLFSRNNLRFTSLQEHSRLPICISPFPDNYQYYGTHLQMGHNSYTIQLIQLSPIIAKLVVLLPLLVVCTAFCSTYLFLEELKYALIGCEIVNWTNQSTLQLFQKKVNTKKAQQNK